MSRNASSHFWRLAAARCDAIDAQSVGESCNLGIHGALYVSSHWGCHCEKWRRMYEVEAEKGNFEQNKELSKALCFANVSRSGAGDN